MTVFVLGPMHLADDCPLLPSICLLVDSLSSLPYAPLPHLLIYLSKSLKRSFPISVSTIFSYFSLSLPSCVSLSLSLHYIALFLSSFSISFFLLSLYLFYLISQSLLLPSSSPLSLSPPQFLSPSLSLLLPSLTPSLPFLTLSFSLSPPCNCSLLQSSCTPSQEPLCVSHLGGGGSTGLSSTRLPVSFSPSHMATHYPHCLPLFHCSIPGSQGPIITVFRIRTRATQINSPVIMLLV